jgi:hypothetical protein
MGKMKKQKNQKPIYLKDEKSDRMFRLMDSNIFGNFFICRNHRDFENVNVKILVISPIKFDLCLFRNNIPSELRKIVFDFFGRELGFFENQIYQSMLEEGDIIKYLNINTETDNNCWFSGILQLTNETFNIHRHIIQYDIKYCTNFSSLFNVIDYRISLSLLKYAKNKMITKKIEIPHMVNMFASRVFAAAPRSKYETNNYYKRINVLILNNSE